MLKSQAKIPESFDVSEQINYESICSHVFLGSEVGLLIVNADKCIVGWNPWFTKYSKITMPEGAGEKLVRLFPRLEGGRVEYAVNQAVEKGMSSLLSQSLNSSPFPLSSSSGQFLEQQIVTKPITLKNQSRFCLIQITDVTAATRRELQLLEQTNRTRAISEKLWQQKERLQVTLNSIADAVITTDSNGIILSMNPVSELLTGVAECDAKGKQVGQVFKVVKEGTSDLSECPVRKCLKEKTIVVNDKDHLLQGTTANFSITDSAAPIFNKNQQMIGSVLVFRDVTQARALSAELNWQALHDPLTGLANRRSFELEMKKLLLKAKTDGLKHHLLYLDLDQFKVVNDTCGHDAGDELLKKITETLDKQVRKRDLFSRLGGDEFGVLLRDCDTEHALFVANKLRKTVSGFRFVWQGQIFKVGVSIGIAEITGEEEKSSEALSAADAACYTAKEGGRNRVHFHDLNSAGSSVRHKEMQWVSRLQKALDNDQFELYLQRIQSTEDLSVMSNHYEVLLRMIGENGELIAPGAFFPAAERFNLVGHLDWWVIEHVFEKIKPLEKSGQQGNGLMLSINLSGASMVDSLLLDRINQLLDESSFPAERFCFEVTETAAIANVTQAQGFLSTLRSRGCKIALDDFGSGLSSFAYLKSLPIDVLKIDGYFVKDIAVDKIDKVFVESINKMGQAMGLTTIAEFVEDDEILKILSHIGVDYAQGYGIHKPCPFDDAISYNC